MKNRTLHYLIRFLVGEDAPSEIVESIGYTNDSNRFDKYNVVIDLQQLETKKKAKQKLQDLQPTDTNALMANKGDLFHYQIIAEKGVCYLQFNQCADARTLRDESLPRWDTMLDEMSCISCVTTPTLAQNFLAVL